MTTAQLKKMKSPTELSEGLVGKKGRPLKKDKKQPITIRLDSSTVQKLRSSGAKWQTRLSDKISQWVIKEL